MNISLPLNEMTVEEKLKVMEIIWEDLMHHADKIPPPAWHGEQLAQRQAALDKGEQELTEWETAKQRIEKAIR